MQLLMEFFRTANGSYTDKVIKELDSIVQQLLKDNRNLKHYVQAIYNLFATLDADSKAAILSGFRINEQVEKLCNDTLLVPYTYKDLGEINTKLSEELKGLCKYLYEGLLHNDNFTDRHETKRHHFDTFCKENNMPDCPFCGILPMESPNTKRVNDYDHFLPQLLYPFLSICFRNLSPMCDRCNSIKWEKDPLYKEGKRRLAFYPYAASIPKIEVNVSLKISFFKGRLGIDDLEVILECEDKERTNTWDDLFDIRHRYADRISQCIKTWLTTLKVDYKQFEQRVDSNEFVSQKLAAYKDVETRLSSERFLKHAIFKALHEQGWLAPALSK